MAKYGYTVDAIALVANTPKTLFELTTPSTAEATIFQWWIEFDNTTTNTPVRIEAQPYASGVTTATSVTPNRIAGSGGTSAITLKHSTTSEGAGLLTVSGSGEIHRVSPTSGIVMMYPLGRELVVPVSTIFRFRVTAGATVNASIGIMWEE